jgi:hypothetical protein
MSGKLATVLKHCFEGNQNGGGPAWERSRRSCWQFFGKRLEGPKSRHVASFPEAIGQAISRDTAVESRCGAVV